MNNDEKNNETIYNKFIVRICLLTYWFYVSVDVLVSKEPVSLGRKIWLVFISIISVMELINLLVYWKHWRSGCRDAEVYKPIINTGSILKGLLGAFMCATGEAMSENRNRSLTPDERCKLEATVREVQRLQTNNPYYVNQNRGNKQK